MKVLTLGHKYELENFEAKDKPGQTIQFIEKVQQPQPITPGGIVLALGTGLVTVNDGTTNEEVLDVLINRLSYLQDKFPCKENACAITHLQEALFWLLERTRKRTAQNVEGKAEAHK